MLGRLLRRSYVYLQRPGDGIPRSVALIPGDGIGPQICAAVQEVFRVIHAPIYFDVIPHSDLHSDEIIARIKRHPAALKGVVYSMIGEGTLANPNMTLRKKLNVFADIVQVFSFPGIKTKHENIDMTIIRENLEGEYSGLEHEVYPGVMESIKVTTQQGARRIAEYAFEFAYLNSRKKVTAVHKANIMKKCDGLFLDATREVAKKYPNIQYNEMIIDNCCMQMIINPWQFDVMVMPNLYGSIVANVASSLVGGSGMTPGANLGTDFAIFEQGTRHKAKDIAGKNIANPTALMLASALMLRHLNLPCFADMVENGVMKTLEQGLVRTPDLGGKNTTTEFTKAVIDNIRT